jgi:hypothetical protein
MSFSVKYTMDGLIERLQATRDAIPEIMSEAVKEIESLAVIALEDACPVDDDENNGTLSGEEGHLVHSFVALDPEASGAKVTGEVATLEPVKFQYVTQGTIGPIFPAEKHALWWPGLAHPVAWVNGQDANPFDQEAKGEFESLIPDVMQEAVAKIAEKLKGL